mgnify:CR=1 FL=1
MICMIRNLIIIIICVFIYILDETIKTCEAASDAVHHVFNSLNAILTVYILHLFLDVLKNNANQSDEGNKEWAKKNTANIVSDQPPVAPSNAEVASSIWIFSKVPATNSNN